MIKWHIMAHYKETEFLNLSESLKGGRGGVRKHLWDSPLEETSEKR
jgi:hypothetical protein